MEPENELIHRMTAGDPTALAEFYDLHAPRVLGFLIRLLPERSDADDVLQEVFLQVWKKAGRFDTQRGNPRAWLFMMARSRAIDWLRSRKVVAPVQNQQLSHYDDPSDKLEQQEATVQVRQALLQLPSEQREAINLSFYNGLAHKEIASHLNIPLGTAKTRIRLGMKRMRVLLGQETGESISFIGRVPR